MIYNLYGLLVDSSGNLNLLGIVVVFSLWYYILIAVLFSICFFNKYRYKDSASILKTIYVCVFWLWYRDIIFEKLKWRW